MAGLAGCLFANWAEIVTPRVFSLGQAAEVLIWVIVGGLGTLIGPILGAIALGYVKLLLGEQTMIDNSLILGMLLIVVVLGFRRGVVPALQHAVAPRGCGAAPASKAARRRAPPAGRANRRASMSGVVETQRAHHALWRRGRRRRGQLLVAGTRAALLDRAQWRGQEHLLQMSDRAISPYP